MNLGGLLVFFLALAFPSFAANAEVLHLPPAARMERADLYYVPPIANPKAILILSPGCNGSGEGLVHSLAWQQFAHQNNLGLSLVSFVHLVLLSSCCVPNFIK